MNGCKVCGSPHRVGFTYRGKRYTRPYCSKHYSAYVYRIQRRNRLARKLREKLG